MPTMVPGPPLLPCMLARGDGKVGAVEAGGPHLDEDLLRAGDRLGDIPDLDAIRADDGSFHVSAPAYR